MSKLQLILKFLCENTVKFRSWLIRWFSLRIKQRLHWFRESTITMTRTMFAFYLQTYWCTHRIIVARIVTQIYLTEIKMDTVEFDMMLFLSVKLRKKSTQKGIESKGFGQRKFLRNISFSLCFFNFSQTCKDISQSFRSVIPLGSTGAGGF